MGARHRPAVRCWCGDRGVRRAPGRGSGRPAARRSCAAATAQSAGWRCGLTRFTNFPLCVGETACVQLGADRRKPSTRRCVTGVGRCDDLTSLSRLSRNGIVHERPALDNPSVSSLPYLSRHSLPRRGRCGIHPWEDVPRNDQARSVQAPVGGNRAACQEPPGGSDGLLAGARQNPSAVRLGSVGRYRERAPLGEGHVRDVVRSSGGRRSQRLPRLDMRPTPPCVRRQG